MKLPPAILTELKRALGPQGLSTSAADLVTHSYDTTRQEARPDALVKPADTAQVAAVLELAHRYRVPVVPVGAATSRSGGPVPVRGGIVLSTARLNKILELDPLEGTARVQPGVVTAALQRAAGEHGLFYPPDPSSAETSTLGGNLAANAGGLRGLKYGVTRDYVLALEAVLPGGEVVRVGAATRKSVAGYSLRDLFVGSEGTLAVITEARLRLIPKPEHTETLQAVFHSRAGAADAVAKVFAARVTPVTMEIIDRHSLAVVRQAQPTMALPEKAEAVLLIETDGWREAARREMEAVEKACREAGAAELKRAADETERAELWRLRRAISPAMYRLKPRKLNEDICVPRGKLTDLFARVDELSADHRVTIAMFGHAGDGNIHVDIMHDPADEEETARAEAAVAELFAATVALGGTISGEHGLGNRKSRFLPLEVGPPALELMRRIKRLLDPHGIMNPGKVFPDEPAGEPA